MKSKTLASTIITVVVFATLLTPIARANASGWIDGVLKTPEGKFEKVDDSSQKLILSGVLSSDGVKNLQKTIGLMKSNLVVASIRLSEGEETPEWTAEWLNNGKDICEVFPNNAFICSVTVGKITGNYILYYRIGSLLGGDWTSFTETGAGSIKWGEPTALNPSVSFINVDVFEKTATIKVSVSNIPMTAIGYLELGIANQKGETAKYTCSAGGPISPKITIPAVSTGTKEISYSFAPPDFPNGLPDGVYCIRPLVDLPSFPKSRIGQGSELDPDTGFWTAPKSIFGIGVSIEPNATADSNANDLGCVNEKDNKSYCLLAPLPGVGDSTGKLDVSTGIGNYFNMIIKLVMGIIGVLAVLMVVVGGIEYMSTVNLGEKEGARARITSAILGLLLALGAYLILKTINPDLVNINIGVPKGVIVEGNPGDDIGESDATIPHTGTATPGVVVPTGTAQELAKQILNSSKITLATESWNGGPSATARQNIIDTINGQGAVTSTRGSKGGTRVPLQTSVLAGAIAVSNVTPIQINAFVNGRHDSSSSRHYVGAAMDIQSAPSEIQRTKTILGACKAAGATEFLGPCNNNVSKKICDATGFPTNSGHQTHIHCGWPR